METYDVIVPGAEPGGTTVASRPAHGELWNLPALIRTTVDSGFRVFELVKDL